MKIDYELKIQKKYFDAILQLKKPFELRHKPIPKGSIVKLVEIEGPILMNMGRCPTKKSKVYFPTGRYIIFKSGECEKIIFNETSSYSYEKTIYTFWPEKYDYRKYEFNKELKTAYISNEGDVYAEKIEWFDDFWWDYVAEKQTYLIEIDEILEVK